MALVISLPIRQVEAHLVVTALPELHPVVEVRTLEPLPPWDVADREPYSFIRLSDATTAAEVGSVMALLVNYNSIEAAPTTLELLAGLVAAEGLILPGGIQASAGGRDISPGCCCGLEGWREWREFLESAESPWMGHDPWPWVEWAGGAVRVWSGRGGPDAGAFAITFERGRFEDELGRVERDLRAFLLRVAAWAHEVGVLDPTAVCRKLDACFHITEIPGTQ